MNFASWVILLIVVVWIGFAVKAAFFGNKGKKGGCHGGSDCIESKKGVRVEAAALEDDGEYLLPSACANCSKGSCSSCSGARLDTPVPIIRELK